MKKRNVVYLQTGTNLGNRLENLTKVNTFIKQYVGKIKAISQVYETEAWGVEEQPNFYNQVLEVVTDLPPEMVLEKILWIESEYFNRARTEKWAARIIDIDILLYNDLVIDTADLIIPHPYLHQRNFVLIPLMEIAGEIQHPILETTIEALYWASDDKLEVFLLNKDNDEMT